MFNLNGAPLLLMLAHVRFGRVDCTGESHVEEGRRIVERQRARVAIGWAGSNALELLATFEQSQAIFEQDLDRLLKERDAAAFRVMKRDKSN